MTWPTIRLTFQYLSQFAPQISLTFNDNSRKDNTLVRYQPERILSTLFYYI